MTTANLKSGLISKHNPVDPGMMTMKSFGWKS